MRFLLATIALLVGCGGAVATDEHVLTIAEVQGAGAESPFDGQNVTVSGVVSGDFQNNRSRDSGDLGGFYLQQTDRASDERRSTGIFIHDGASPAKDVKPGDSVQVTGTVKEFFGETQINASSVAIDGSGYVAAYTIELPFETTQRNEDGAAIADLEHLEGMLVHIEQTLTVSGLRGLEQFGEVDLSANGRLLQFSNQVKPSPSGYATHKTDVAKRRIVLDDGDRDRNPDTIRYLQSGDGAMLRVGDSVDQLTGNLRFSKGSGGNGEQTWRLQPTVTPIFRNNNPRPGAPSIGGTLRVAGVNALNFFTTLDIAGAKCGPAEADNCRGADSSEEFMRQLGKTVSALSQLDADIIALMELENNEAESLQVLVDALNVRTGSIDYDFVRTGSIHDGPIKTGYLYRRSKVATAGRFALLDSQVDSRFNDARNRPALAQSFRMISNDALLTLVANHFKSKGSSCAAEGDPNNNDGQGNCNAVRTQAALALAEWMQSDPTNSGDADYLLLGDFNAYSKEDPIAAFRDKGLVNLLDTIENPYSLNYSAQSGALDHAIASPPLSAQVVDVMVWHINADEAPLHDYNLEHGRSPDLFDAASPYRASDHDPIVIGLELRAD